MNYAVVALVGLTALAVVAWPLLRRGDSDSVIRDDATLERRIADYRAALQADTVCSRCLRDNPADARYCAECGNALREIQEG